MKVVCISNTRKNNYEYQQWDDGKIKDLSVGKIYDVLEDRRDGLLVGYLIIDDKFERSWFPQEQFITLSEQRDYKLNEILS